MLLDGVGSDEADASRLWLGVSSGEGAVADGDGVIGVRESLGVTLVACDLLLSGCVGVLLALLVLGSALWLELCVRVAVMVVLI